MTGSPTSVALPSAARGGVIIFLVWLWLTNVAILLGAEFDAELSRARAIASGLPAKAEPYVPMRDVPKHGEPLDSVDFTTLDIEPEPDKV